MWTCPKCKHKFFNKNQSHSCGSYSVDDFLKGRTRHAIALFNHFLAEYEKIGEFELHPVKTRVALLTKMRFASINRVAEDHIDIHLVLTEPHNQGSIFYKVDNLGGRFYVHHLRLYDKAGITPEVKRCMKFAYAVGERQHVVGRKN